jgi:starvation-inducible DNA-binding protein
MDRLTIDGLQALLADTVALKFKAHGYHWNVEGDDFPQWHDKFAAVYEDMDNAIDGFAEWIRMIDINSFPKFNLADYASLTTVEFPAIPTDPVMMAADLCASIEAITVKIVMLADHTTNMKQYGLANFLGDRQTAHQKWCWQLGVALKNMGE